MVRDIGVSRGLRGRREVVGEGTTRKGTTHERSKVGGREGWTGASLRGGREEQSIGRG